MRYLGGPMLTTLTTLAFADPDDDDMQIEIVYIDYGAS